MVDNFIKWSVCQKCLVWQKWTVIKSLGVRGTSYWCTNSSHFLATIMHGENLSKSWDILVEEKRKQHFCFRRVCLPHYLIVSYWWHFKMKATCLYSSYGSFITVHLCHAKHFQHTAAVAMQLHIVCIVCLRQIYWLSDNNKNQSGTCQLQDLGFTITMHPFLQALPSKLGGYWW